MIYERQEDFEHLDATVELFQQIYAELDILTALPTMFTVVMPNYSSVISRSLGSVAVRINRLPVLAHGRLPGRETFLGFASYRSHNRTVQLTGILPSSRRFTIPLRDVRLMRFGPSVRRYLHELRTAASPDSSDFSGQELCELLDEFVELRRDRMTVRQLLALAELRRQLVRSEPRRAENHRERRLLI